MQTRLGFLVGLGLGLAFSLGFAVATWMTPHAEAQASSSYGWPARWEYMVVNHGFDHARWANEQGRDGWRFVGYDHREEHEMIFERPAH